MTLAHISYNRKTKKLELLPICTACGSAQQYITVKKIQNQFKKISKDLNPPGRHHDKNIKYEIILHLCPDCKLKKDLELLTNQTDYYEKHSQFTQIYLESKQLENCENSQNDSENKGTVH